MCGRFTLYSDIERLMNEFDLMNGEELFTQERYNIAPSENILAVVQSEKGKKAGWLRWGLIPPWASDEKIGHKMINARSETVAEKPSFRKAFKQRRCMIITDGFYEWKNDDGKKKPVFIHLEQKKPFAFAGLWESWQSETGEQINSCTILTTTANEIMKPIHNRMPVILNEETEQIWLDRTVQDQNKLQECLIQYPSEKMAFFEVSTLVNSPKNDSSDCIQPV
jgi:putative SOS response-associated peptidase YedK